jgi:hypothetical protein
VSGYLYGAVIRDAVRHQSPAVTRLMQCPECKQPREVAGPLPAYCYGDSRRNAVARANHPRRNVEMVEVKQ